MLDSCPVSEVIRVVDKECGKIGGVVEQGASVSLPGASSPRSSCRTRADHGSLAITRRAQEDNDADLSGKTTLIVQG